MKKILLILSFSIFTFWNVFSQQLIPGAIAFVLYNGDATEGFAVVAMGDLPGSTVIYFTDNGINSDGSLRGGEGTVTWTTPAGGVACGTEVTFLGYSASVGTSTGSMTLSGSGDQIISYQGGLNSPTNYITAIDCNGGFITTGTTTSNTSYLPAGLTIGTTAIEVLTEVDNSAYNPTSGVSFATTADALAAANDNANWTLRSNSATQNPPGAFTITTCAVVLPIELTSFTAKEKNNTIQLNWQTATELNNSHFEIEHSKDGQNFELLDIIEGAGTTFETQNYSFIDESPLSGINYYRLKQVDYDGAFEYSKTVAVETGKTEDWTLYPTRSQNEVNVEWAEEYPVTTVSVFDITGKRVFEQKINPEETYSTTISTFNFPEGMYFLRMMTNRSVSTKPFFKVQ